MSISINRPFRVLAIQEAASITGPAKNLLNFARWAMSPDFRGDLRPEFSIATFCRDGRTNGFIEAARECGLPVHVIEEHGPFDRAALKRLADVAEETQPDVVQTHAVKSHFLWRLANPGFPWIAFLHGHTAENLRYLCYNQLDRWSLRTADRIVTVCEAFVPRIQAYGIPREKIRVLHNSIVPPAPVSEQAKADLRRSLGVDPEERIILSIGRFSNEKGQLDLIEALAALRDRQTPRWKAVLVGAGVNERMLRAAVARKGLGDHVVFAGVHRDVSPFYATASVFALPSRSEGSPNVVLEAMASRVPIAATAAGGTPELISNLEEALLTPIRKPAALARSIENLLNDDELARRLSDAAYCRAVREFSPARYRHDLLSVYASVEKRG